MMSHHFNIQHPKTKKWRCYSTIINGWTSSWLDEKEYKDWLKMYHNYEGPIKKTELDDFEKIIYQKLVKSQYCSKCLKNCENCIYNLNFIQYKEKGLNYLGDFLNNILNN